MAVRRRAPRSRLHRRRKWTAAFAVPAGLIAVAATLTMGAAESPTPQTSPPQLLAGTATAEPSPASTSPAPTAADLQPALVATAQSLAVEATTPLETRPGGLPLEAGKGGVPQINYTAYKNAEALLAERQPQCGIDWTLIAAIGRVESTHANNGAASADGTLLTPIFGPVLDGSLDGNAIVKDTDGGELDGDPHYDRAVGPAQFLPETWQAYSADGNGDGKIDPQNLFDAAFTTGLYLCHGNLDLRDPADVAKAVLRYNNSQAYVNDVVGFAQQYAAH